MFHSQTRNCSSRRRYAPPQDERIIKKILLSCFVIALSTFATIANATQNNNQSLYFAAESGWSNMASGHVSPYRFLYKKSFGYRAAMGYLFPLNTAFSLGPEIAYGYYGLISYQNTSGIVVHYESTGWSALASLKHALTNCIDLYLKGGVTEVFQQYEAFGPNVTKGGFYQRKFCPSIIAAGSYNLTPHTALSLSYTHIFANSAPLTSKTQLTFTDVNEISSIDAVMVGVIYKI